MIEFQKFLFFYQFIIELFQIFWLSRVLRFEHLYESPFKLPRCLFNMLQGIAGELPHPHLMAFGVDMAFESILVFALFPAQLAEMFEPSRAHYDIMNNDIKQQDQELKKARLQVLIQPQQLAKLLSQRKRFIEKVNELNSKAISCMNVEKWQQALVYLESAELILESGSEKGHLTDHCLVQCILHNQAGCYQNMWQLDKSSNYIEALIFNLNSRLKSEPSSPMSIYAQRERKLSKLGLAEYYLQFCAVNSQLSNHSGALISARKSLDLLKNQLKQWKKSLQSKKSKSDLQQKLRIIQIVNRFNDNINLNSADTLEEATSYYLKSWKISCLKIRAITRQAKQLMEEFTIKSIMTLSKLSYEQCMKKYQKQPEMNLHNIFLRILAISVCYFTIATELRLISMKKSRESNSNKIDQPQYKQSQIYHLLSIVLLALCLTSQSLFLNHLVSSFHTHYQKNIFLNEVSFKKAFTEIVFIKDQRYIRQTSIQCSEHEHEDGLMSYLSKGSGTMIRITKGSKESDRQNKFSLIDPKAKKSKMKKTKRKQSKTKKEISSIKGKHPRQSISKTPHYKSGSKQSIIIKSHKSKKSLSQQKGLIPSIKLICGNKKKSPNSKVNDEKKSKRKAKIQSNNSNDYFLMKKNDQKKPKKTSVSSQKSISHIHSTERLPINSTLDTKDTIARQKKKTTKKNLLQHYL